MDFNYLDSAFIQSLGIKKNKKNKNKNKKIKNKTDNKVT